MKFNWRHFSRKPPDWWDPGEPGVFEASQLAWFREGLIARNPVRVLEIGVGRGRASQRLQGAWQYVGLDVNRSLLVKARSIVPGGLLVGSGTHLPFRDEMFDAVVAFDVLMHIYERKDFFSECRRVLAPDGILLVNFLRRFSRGWRRYVIAFGLHPIRTWESRDRRFDTVRSFASELEAEGFQGRIAMSNTSVPLVEALPIKN